MKSYSPVAGVLDLAMFCYNNFFAFFDRTWCQDEILPGWEVVAGLAFSQSKMAAKIMTPGMKIKISLHLLVQRHYMYVFEGDDSI